jgi:hypothetical protein
MIALMMSVPLRWEENSARARGFAVLGGPEEDNAKAVMVAAWQAEQGREPTTGELVYSLAVAKLESSWGKGWKGAMVGSNNWGAVQCGGGSNPSQCVEYEDSHSDGTKYKVGFRKYASPVDGARDVVRHLTKLRPLTWAVMRDSGPISEFSRAMRVERYYGGFCPVATKQYGKSVIHYGKPPEDSPAKKACHEEAIAGHAKYMDRVIKTFAPALGLPVPPVGTAPAAPPPAQAPAQEPAQAPAKLPDEDVLPDGPHPGPQGWAARLRAAWRRFIGLEK